MDNIQLKVSELPNRNDAAVENAKKNVDGIILVLSCQKHKNTRLKEFSLSKTSYNNWEVIYVIGDLLLNKNYRLDENFLYIRLLVSSVKAIVGTIIKTFLGFLIFIKASITKLFPKLVGALTAMFLPSKSFLRSRDCSL